jgi:hypothetical protein
MPGYILVDALMRNRPPPEPFQGAGASGSWGPPPTLSERWNKTYTKGLLDALMGAATLPGDVYQGKVEAYPGLTSPETIRRSADLAGLLTMEAGAIPAAGNELRAGLQIPKLQGLSDEFHPATISAGRSGMTRQRQRLIDTDVHYSPASLATMAKDPAVFAGNMELLKNRDFYPGMGPLRTEDMSPEQLAHTAMNVGRSNLKYFIEHATPEQLIGGANWYPSAYRFNQGLAERYGLPQQSATGITAALSPQQSWEENLYFARQVPRIYHEHMGDRWDDAMTQAAQDKLDPEYLARLQRMQLTPEADPGEVADFIKFHDLAHGDPEQGGTRYVRSFDPATGEFDTGDQGWIFNQDGVTRPEARWKNNSATENAIMAIRSGGDRRLLSEAMGGVHKVPSFYNEMLNPFLRTPGAGNPVMDTHAIGAHWMAPLGGETAPAVGHGLSTVSKQMRTMPGWRNPKDSGPWASFGTYGLYADTVRDVARELGVPTSSIQAQTWVGKRDLFEVVKKDKGAMQAIDTAWKAYNKGGASLRETQDEVWRIGRNANERRQQRLAADRQRADAKRRLVEQLSK